jgi:protein-S-isoprenylcysteine O-methyltransferase Ste14
MTGPFAAQKASSQKPEFSIELLDEIVAIRLHLNTPQKKSAGCDRFSQEAAHEGVEAETMQSVETNKTNAATRTESRKENSMLKRTMILMYGVMAYMAFFATICYAIGFVGNYLVPKSVDTGEMGDISTAVLANAAMLALFAIQHTIMARPGFKRWVTQYIPKEVERSTFVITASLILAGTFYYWRPIPAVLWSVENPVIVMMLHCTYFLGWAMVFGSSFLINHFDLFGLRQVMLAAMKKPYTQLPFRMTILYKFVRHPLMLGFLIAFWSSPEMTLGHFLFSGLTTCYILMGIQFEERDLEREHGEKYRAYKAAVPMLLPYKGAVREEAVAAPVTAAQ